MANGHGGKREGAGRPFKEAELLNISPVDDPVEFFKQATNDVTADAKLRLEAAKAWASYTLAKPEAGGKKKAKEDAAKSVASKFGNVRPLRKS